MNFRIKQLDENVFIPQVKKRFFSKWKGIQKNNYKTWHSNDFQRKYCAQDTYPEALSQIQIWKHKDIKEKIYPKYFKAY